MVEAVTVGVAAAGVENYGRRHFQACREDPVARLLVVHHTPSPSVREMLEQVLKGTTAEGLEDVDVVDVPALQAGPSHVLGADGIILGTPANIGYMSGALKHFFDQVYYPCLGATDGLPYGLYLHGNNDTEGARRAVEWITKALSWEAVAEPVAVIDSPDADDLEACWNLGATVAAAAAGLA